MNPLTYARIYALQLFVVCASVMSAVIVTGNPLALFGLMLVWSAPPLVLNDEEEPESASHAIGF